MHHMYLRCLGALLAVFTAMAWAAPATAERDSVERGTGFLVAAPDRGFLGNEEIRDLFEAFAAERNAALVHVTDERTRQSVEAALARLATAGAKRAVVLPLFMSAAERRHATLQAALQGASALPVSWARPFGESHLAAEAIADRLRAAEPAEGRRLVLVGAGAADRASTARIAADLRRLGESAAAGLGFGAVEAAVWPERDAPEADALSAEAAAHVREGAGAVVVHAHLARKLDSMMAFANTVERTVPPESRLLPEEPISDPALTWMRREANQALPWPAERIGVVISAHGSDWHWNEKMREAVRQLEARHPVEYAFSMADPPVIERAVRRLERRGVRAIVIVRVFALADSFEGDIARLIGADVEAGEGAPSMAAHHRHGGQGHGEGGSGHASHDQGTAGHNRAAHHHGHGSAPQAAGTGHGGEQGPHAAHGSAGSGGHGHGHGHGSGAPAPRIRSTAVLLTAGGLDDHPHFARALLDRARALSKDPARETVILTAHGTDDDARNARWLKMLESIAARMRAEGPAFRAIRVATWREDWPDKRDVWVPRVRAWVEEASRDGAAIVIPARTTGTGPEEELLAGLNYRLGSGFAPHPLFVPWIEAQVERAVGGHRRELPAATDGVRR